MALTLKPQFSRPLCSADLVLWHVLNLVVQNYVFNASICKMLTHFQFKKKIKINRLVVHLQICFGQGLKQSASLADILHLFLS